MPENSALSAARLLSVVTWISRQPHGQTTVGEVARHFSRSVSQVERDLEHLTYFRDSLPGESFELVWEPAPAGSRGKARQNNPVQIRQSHGMSLPAVFTPELAAQTLVGLKAITPLVDDELRHSIPTAMLAVEHLAPRVGNIASAVESLEHTTDSVLPTLRTAIEEGKALHFSYVSRRAESTERRVIPVDLHRETGGWLLQAFDLDRMDYRRFRVPQIFNIQVTSVPHGFHLPPHESDHTPSIRLLINARAQWLLDDYATAESTPESPPSDKAYIGQEQWPRWVTMRVWNPQWVMNTIIAASPGIEQIEAPELLQDLAEQVHAATQTWHDVLSSWETQEAR